MVAEGVLCCDISVACWVEACCIIIAHVAYNAVEELSMHLQHPPLPADVLTS